MKSLFSNKMSASLRKTAVLAAAVASLSFAGTSWAGPEAGTINFSAYQNLNGVSVSLYNNENPELTGQGTSAGMFEMTVVVNSTYPEQYGSWENTDPFYAFCLDINNFIQAPSTYDVSGLSAGETGFNGYLPDLSLSALQVAQMNKLVDLYFSDVDDFSAAGNNAAMQIALWEVVNEAGATFDAGSGSFYVTGDSSAISNANAFLNALNGIGTDYVSGNYDLLLLAPITPEDTQGLLGWCTKGDCDPENPNEVSEPGSLLLLSAGLSMIFFGARRRSLRV